MSNLRESDRGPSSGAHLSDTALRERVALTAHELRSPLNTILAWAQVLEQSLPAKRAPPIDRALAGIRDGVARQVSLIEQLTRQSRLPERDDNDESA